jgi:glucose-6-phosphate isomerase
MITASRMGSAPLTWDWSNLGRVEPADPMAASAAWEKLKSRFSAGEVGFYDAPVDTELTQITQVQALADSILGKNIFTDCLFLGIGGSSLGPLSLLNALEDRRTSSIRFHFMENPDALEWRSTLKKLRPETTLVCAVTKSGTTFETLAQLLLAMEWMGEGRLKSHLVAITDPVRGDLKAFAQARGIPTLHIAPSIGGRFSVFTPVGLFAAALAGLSISDFIQGAKQVRDYCEKTPLERNSLFTLASELLRHYPKRSSHVCMPYSSRLRTFGDWFVQLWGESLGKDGKGFTPVAALGATDQHSILQLLRDGPDDKVTMFLAIDQVQDEVKVPHLSMLRMANLPAFKILEGTSLHSLLRYEFQATSLVLTRQNRPNLTIQLDRLDERAMGSLYFAFCVLTAVTGTLWNVNPFDQPGVEEGKVYIKKSLTDATSQADTRADEEDENSPVNRLRRHRETEQ